MQNWILKHIKLILIFDTSWYYSLSISQFDLRKNNYYYVLSVRIPIRFHTTLHASLFFLSFHYYFLSWSLFCLLISYLSARGTSVWAWRSWMESDSCCHLESWHCPLRISKATRISLLLLFSDSPCCNFQLRWGVW